LEKKEEEIVGRGSPGKRGVKKMAKSI